MKKTLGIFIAILISSFLFAQQGKGKTKDKGKPSVSVDKGNDKQQGKEKDKDKDKSKEQGIPNIFKDDHDKKVFDGINSSQCGIPSKNQPAKVRAAFQRDYPNAGSVRWTKCRGDWTATFNNGVFRSTAIYHANGQRKDTRTPIPADQAPRNIFDIFKKETDDNKKLSDIFEVVKVEKPSPLPQSGDKSLHDVIYRIKTIKDQKTQFVNSSGQVVSYSY